MKPLMTIVVALALTVAAAGAAAATAPTRTAKLAVEFHGPVTLSTQTGEFIASGPAVDVGLICPAGTTEGIGFLQPRPDFVITTKRFTCADGSGEFYVRLMATVVGGVPPGDSVFTWRITPGPNPATGAYAHLVGRGEGSGIWDGSGSDVVHDSYQGQVHLPGGKR